MFLKELVEYYEIIADDEKYNLPKLGFGKEPVAYIIDIDENGTILDIIPNMDTSGKKAVAKSIMLPIQSGRSGKIPKSYFLCDYATYVLGIDKPDVDKKTGVVKHKFSKEKFEYFKDYNISILEKADCDEARAIIKFLENLDVEKDIENEKILAIETDLSTSRVVFSVKGKLTTTIKEINDAWVSEYSNSEKLEIGKCSITGKEDKIARLHPSFKNISMDSSAMIVSFNQVAFESYGKEQGNNAPIGRYSIFAYGTALKMLLADRKNYVRIGDICIVFWAKTKEKKISDEMAELFSLEDINSDDEKIVADEYTEKSIKKYFENVAIGKPMGIPDFEKNVEVCIMGISASKARASVRFFYKNTFGRFAENMFKFYNELRLVRSSEKELKPIPLFRIMAETIPKKSDKQLPNKALTMAMLNSIIKGIRYPELIYSKILYRVKKDKAVNYYRTAMIKAFLLRNINNNIKEVLTVSINNETSNKAYLLGNLFAVLEKLQKNSASSELNTTIKVKYFSTACERPGSIFPKLLIMSNYYIKRYEYGYAYEKMITDLMSKIEYDAEPFPARFTKAEQGIFILGYYHKNKDLYTKKEEK